jgi:uncharacterized protein (DUF1501 family)
MNDIYDQPISRRKFFGVLSCAALGTTGLFSTLLNLKMTGQAVAANLDSGTGAAQANDDFKALVCIFQAGGNDSYNMLIPTNTAQYNDYKTARGNLAHPLSGAGAALPINAQGTAGRTYAIHPAMPELRDLFNAGKAAFITNTGTLIEPTTVAQYKNSSVKIPKALFSHNDQIFQWQTSVPQGNATNGWAGRMADVLKARVSGSGGAVGMNISLSGNNIMQTSQQTTAYAISPKGSLSLIGNNSNNNLNMLRFDKFTSMADVQYQNLFEQAYMQELKQSVERDALFSKAFASAAAQIKTVFVDEDLGADLKAVAQTIAARNALGMRRQIFFILYGGWDHHQELLQTQEYMLGVLSKALKNFWDALVELNVQDKVVTFTASDFGRTLRSNGRGTDHAWGGNHIMLGGPVIGQRLYGTYPEVLRLGDGLDVGSNGRLLPTTAVDEYMAELALWFGVQPNELATVLPNIGNFYDVTATAGPLGFLRM